MFFFTFVEMKKWCFILSGVLFLVGCSDQIDVNAPYEDTTVIYGLLNKNDNRHYVKINKAFLGELDAEQMAQIADSSQYEMLSARVQELDGNAGLVNEFVLLDTLVSNKEAGAFYAPEHKLYYFDASLNADHQYKIIVDVPQKELQVFGQTPIIKDFSLSGGTIFGNSVVDVGFKSPAGQFVDQNYQWVSKKDARSYQLTMVVNYDNFYLDNTSETKELYIDYPNQNSLSLEGGESMQQEISGEAFYQQLEARIPSKSETPNLSHRKLNFFTFEMVVAGDELATFIEVNAPSTGINQDKPLYTNIENGIGVFSTRISLRSIFEKQLNNLSKAELYDGIYTKDLGFCANSGAFVCPN